MTKAGDDMKPIQLITPVDGSVWTERMPLTLDAAEKAVARARAAQPSWAARPLDDRIRLVLAGITKLGAMNDAVTEELAWQMGRPVRFGGEFRGVKERASYMASIARDALAPHVIEEGGDFHRYIARAPHGVMFVMAPWNYPYMTAINSIVPGLIAGNTVVLKHASQTLLAGERLAGAFHQAGVPADVFQNVVLDHATAEALIRDRRFDFVNFTGSVAAGRIIERTAAGTFTPLALELGGKDPGYVRADADIDAAAESLMDAVTFNSGQSCCAIERIYVQQAKFDDFVDKARNCINHLKLGNPFDRATSLGPMANRRFADTVRDHVAQAIRQGAEPLIDPARFDAADDGAYVAPQILVNVNHQMKLMNEETFGPVVGIMPVKDDEEAIRLMNDSPYGLTASIWTGDHDAAVAIGDRLETGTVYMNRADYLDPALCWNGCKDSGRGGSLSNLGYLTVTRPKSYHLKKI